MNKHIKTAAICGAALFVVFSIVAGPTLLHQKRVQSSIQEMAQFEKEDWSLLYIQGLHLLEVSSSSNSAAENDTWPSLVKKIRPSYVWVREDYIFLKWTGGFSPDYLAAYICRENIETNGELLIAGITVHDSTNTIPLQPYKITSKNGVTPNK